MISETINEVREYLQSKAPENSRRKKILIGQKQQQTITNILSQNSSPTFEEEKEKTTVKTGTDKGWGKVR